MIIRPIFPWWIVVTLAVIAIGWLLYCMLRRPKQQRLLWGFRIAFVALLLIITLRPSLPYGVTQSGSTNFDVFVAIDRTASMFAEDYETEANRMAAVRKDAVELTTELAGARISLIEFASSTTTTLPLTTDMSAFATGVSVITQEATRYSQGSSIDAPLKTLEDALKVAKAERPERKRLIVYIGDGEQTASTSPKSFSALKPYIDGGVVLGYGTSTGGKMLQYMGSDQKQLIYIDDPKTNKPALSKIDESNLQKIAADMGISYAHRVPQGSIPAILSDAGTAKLEADSKEIAGYTELYWIAALGIFVVLFCELRYMSIQLRQVAREDGGSV